MQSGIKTLPCTLSKLLIGTSRKFPKPSRIRTPRQADLLLMPYLVKTLFLESFRLLFFSMNMCSSFLFACEQIYVQHRSDFHQFSFPDVILVWLCNDSAIKNSMKKKQEYSTFPPTLLCFVFILALIMQ